MDDRNLKKLNRKELLELLVASEEDNVQLRNRLEEQDALLRSKDIKATNAGSLAEAALALNGVFDQADRAAAQYLENIRRSGEEQKAVREKQIAEAEQQARGILDDAEAIRLQARETLAAAEAEKLRAEKLLADAEAEKQRKMQAADEYWQDLSRRLDLFYLQHPGLEEYVIARSRKKGESKG